ncbi:MAG: Omp28-related outer membrane protein [Saprospiraceae bacterium]
MQKIYFPLLFVLFIQGAVFGQEVPQEQKIVITKIAATWCPPCGGTAWDNFDVINDTYAGKAIMLTAHPSRSSKLHAPESIDFSGNLPQAFGQPLFYINRTKYTTSTILENTEAAINEANNVTPIANTGLNATISDNLDLLQIKAKVKFFQEGDGAYYLSLLVLEDGVIEEQANRGNSAVHKRVLRSSLMGGTFGQEIASGLIAADTEFNFTDSKTLEANWNTDSIEVAAIIWQKVEGVYEFVNAHSVNVSFSTSTNFLETAGVNFSVQPTLIQETATISIDSPIAFDKVNVAIFNTAGQQVQSVFSGALNTGLHSFSINKSNLGGSGIYFLQMESEGSVISRKIVVD